MRKLYAIAEMHFGFGVSMVEKLYHTFPYGSNTRQLYSIAYRRAEKIRRFLDKYRPKVVFNEGIQNADEIIDAGYNGKIIYLDEGHKPYEDMVKEIDDLKKNLKISDEDGNILPYEEIVENINELVIKADEIREKHNTPDFHADRERHWVKEISRNYLSPSAIWCGAGHLCDGVEFLKIFSYYLRVPQVTFALLSILNERKKEKISIFNGLLKKYEIDTQVRMVLQDKLNPIALPTFIGE